MNNSKMVKCYIKNGGSSKQCLLNGIHTEDEWNAQKCLEKKVL